MKAIKLSSLILSFVFFFYGVFVNAQDQTQQKCKVHIKITEDGKEVADTNFTLSQECGSKEIEKIISEITGNKFSSFIESDSLANWNILSVDDSSKTTRIIKITNVEADIDCKKNEDYSIDSIENLSDKDLEIKIITGKNKNIYVSDDNTSVIISHKEGKDKDIKKKIVIVECTKENDQ